MGMFHVGDVIRKLREAQKWTQDDLRIAATVDLTTIVRAEKGRRSRSLNEIARALGLSGEGDLYRLLHTATGPVTNLMDADDAAFWTKYKRLTSAGQQKVREFADFMQKEEPGDPRDEDAADDSFGRTSGRPHR